MLSSNHARQPTNRPCAAVCQVLIRCRHHLHSYEAYALVAALAGGSRPFLPIHGHPRSHWQFWSGSLTDHGGMIHTQGRRGRLSFSEDSHVGKETLLRLALP